MLRFQPSETGLTAVTLAALFYVAFTAGVLAVIGITAVGYKSGAETPGGVVAVTPRHHAALGIWRRGEVFELSECQIARRVKAFEQRRRLIQRWAKFVVFRNG